MDLIAELIRSARRMHMSVAVMFVFACLQTQGVRGQELFRTAVFTSDIDNFWLAYDSIHKTSDKDKHQHIMQTLYVDAGTPGLRAFMSARNYSAANYISLIDRYPAFWKSVRKNTLAIKSQVTQIQQSIERFKTLYPGGKSAGIYFTIGGLKSGGTTTDSMVLIGAEIAAADTGTDASELSNWLKAVFNSQVSGNIVGLNLHEYIHTQQRKKGSSLVAQCLMEGSADFIAELVTRQKNLNDYMIYGQNNEATLKQRFRNEMWRRSVTNWLYNGEKSEHPDLGYFMGYTICRAYYNLAADKRAAITEIVELDFSDREALASFIEKSGYYPNSKFRTQ